MIDIKWQGTFSKRASHAYLKNQSVGEMSLCNRENLHNGDVSINPLGNACSNCLKKIEILNSKSTKAQ